MMKLECVNLDDIILNGFRVDTLTIHYRFHFKNDQQNTSWRSKQFTLKNIHHDNCFWFKVPLFLFSYKIEFNLNIKPDGDDKSETSATHIHRIPSMLIESKHSVGDKVQYCVPNAGFVRSGVILEVLDDKIKIRTNPGYPGLD
eukprot:348613_1